MEEIIPPCFTPLATVNYVEILVCAPADYHFLICITEAKQLNYK